MFVAIKSPRALLCFAVYVFAITYCTSIPQTIFDNYKKGANQFVVVIDYLKTGVDKAKPLEWAQRLQNHVQALPLPFHSSLTESESEKAKLDQSTIDLVRKSGETEAQIAQLQSTISSHQAVVNSRETEVSVIEL